MKKVPAILIVIIIIVALIFTAWKAIKNTQEEITLAIKIDDDLPALQGGEINTFRVESSPSVHGKILLPPGIYPHISGQLQVESKLEFSTTPFTFDALVPPVEKVNITVVAEGEEVNMDFDVVNGSNPMVSGSYWYELERGVTDDINGYNGRYIGGGSPQLERAAEFFRGTFEGFGLEARTVLSQQILDISISINIHLLN